jgi:hypothetical protein
MMSGISSKGFRESTGIRLRQGLFFCALDNLNVQPARYLKVVE